MWFAYYWIRFFLRRKKGKKIQGLSIYTEADFKMQYTLRHMKG